MERQTAAAGVPSSRPNGAESLARAVARGVPRWPAVLVALAIGSLYLLISERRTAGPNWLVLVVVVALLVPFGVARWQSMDRAARWLSLALVGAITAAIAVSVALLVAGLAAGKTAAGDLLRDAALIWVANVLAFALWYWEVDGGGPAERRMEGHQSTDFVFPQMTIDDAAARRWSPLFVDYLFLAFNTSTAFSPTDTMVLSRRAKLLMMGQSLISLVVLAVLAARAINTL